LCCYAWLQSRIICLLFSIMCRWAIRNYFTKHCGSVVSSFISYSRDPGLKCTQASDQLT
jgi:hypothetical protein